MLIIFRQSMINLKDFGYSYDFFTISMNCANENRLIQAKKSDLIEGDDFNRLYEGTSCFQSISIQPIR